MKSAALVLCSVLSLCYATNTGSPVEKVVKLLVDMKEKLLHDGALEKAVYEEYTCWCTGMTTKKGKSIEDAKTELETLGGEIITLSSKIASLSASIDEAAKDMKEAHEEIQTASEQHELEVASFRALRAEMGQGIQSLNQALKMLNVAPQFLQTQSSLSTQQVDMLRSVIAAIPDKALGSLPAAKLSQLQHVATALNQGKYDPSYGSIVTILEELDKTFTEDLEKETKAQATSEKDFQDSNQLKFDRIKKLQEQVDKELAKKATAAKDMADKTTNYDDTEAQMEADITFFNDAVKSCKAKAATWTTRKEMRAEELSGVEEAIKILSSDEARELFGKSISAGSRAARTSKKNEYDNSFETFLQVDATPAKKQAQDQAFQVLKSLGSKSVALARIAAQVRMASGGHFDAVMKAIDDVITVLKTEQESDNAKKKQCNDEYHGIAKTKADLEWKIEKNVAMIEKLTTTIENKEEEKSQTVKAIEDVDQQLIDMKKQRKDAKEAYDEAKKDDEDAITLLKQAKTALQAFAKKNGIDDALTSLIQGAEPKFDRGDAAPDAKFSDKGSRAVQTKGITQLLESIVEGLEEEVKMQNKIELDSIADYEEAKKAAEDLKLKLETKRDNLTAEIADRKQDKVDEEKKKTDNEADLKSEVDYKAEIQPDCDFMLENWQSRFGKRKAETDGLNQAKDYLAGSMKDDGASLVAQKSKLKHVAPH